MSPKDMSMEERWWKSLVNSVRFLDDIVQELERGGSVQVVFDTEAPWRDVMLEVIEQKLSQKNDSKTFDVLDVTGVRSPGEYLMEKYCDDDCDDDDGYWPITHGSREYYMAKKRDISLNRTFVCITGVSKDNVAMWHTSIDRYLENCDENVEHGVILLMIDGATELKSKHMSLFKYSEYVSDYDCMMLCLTIISSAACTKTQKMYICEVAGNIAGNRADHAGLLAAKELELIKDPYSSAAEVFAENGIACDNLPSLVKKSVWEAQIKLVFPKLENFRADMIQKHGAKLQRYLPIRNSYNEIIERVSDLEIGQLFHICKEYRTEGIVNDKEFERLKRMRDARNTLAHSEPLSYSQLDALDIL